MFLLPAMVTLSIAATRIYRSLVDFASIGGTEQYDIIPFLSSQRLTVIDGVG